jgi:hypothetical protein
MEIVSAAPVVRVSGSRKSRVGSSESLRLNIGGNR